MLAYLDKAKVWLQLFQLIEFSLIPHALTLVLTKDDILLRQIQTRSETFLFSAHALEFILCSGSKFMGHIFKFAFVAS